MRYCLLLLFFILLAIDTNASWQAYQNDLRSTGSADGAGYFPLQTSNFSDDSLGMDFQPLVDDLDADGKNEIVIFANDSLIVFNSQLKILNQTKIGGILGQPALFNLDNDSSIEIIFNSRQNSDYFFAYQFNNSNLRQEFNITLPNEANFSGIKCLNLNGTNSCVFKDKKGYIHIINMASKNDSSYNTSIYEERRQTVPAIGDIDNDGNMEAVWWFNEDNSSGYGFLVFDLINEVLDANFNNSGIVDNIFLPLWFELKGQPVLVDLDNDGKLEIAASVFYDDAPSIGTGNDYFTELFVYHHNGTRLFSKCGRNTITNQCNDGGSESNKWDGTNPLVLDYDNNGLDDICLIKSVQKNIGVVGFENMSLNCYDYAGNEIANINLSVAPDGIKGNAIAADMDNDGDKEIITFHDVYMLNGTILYGIGPVSTGTVAVPVDIDGNRGLDLAYTFNGQTKVFLDSSNYSVDLSVGDITFSRINSTHINVSAVIKNTGQIEVNGVKAIVYNTETLENDTATIDLRRNGNFTLGALLGLRENQKILVNVDFDNEINESNEDNNFAFKEFVDLPYVFISLDNLEPSVVQSEFRNYIKNKLASGYYAENENDANIKVYIGKSNPVNMVSNVKTLDEFEFGYDFGNVMFNDETASNPYAALVGAFKEDGKVKIMIVGNEIEGDIIGVKKFIENQALLLNTKDKEAVFAGDEDIGAIKVYDYLHTGGNDEHYNINNEQFKAIVRNALNDEMFNVFDKSVVSSNGITLRLRNLKPNASSNYLEYLNSSGVPIDLPVVLAHGLFSNLTTWEALGAELSNIGRDTWLIEITGGPYQDCDDCIDYTFYNLTDIFVPALLNGVLDFTGKEQIQYVGFSNGCRSALDSLERGKFDSSKVETFVAVGCPGAFEGNSTAGTIIESKDGQIHSILKSSNLSHVSFKNVALIALLNRQFVTKDDKLKISNNLWKFYEDMILLKNDTQPGNVNFENFIIVRGNAFYTDDGIVTVIDEDKIFRNANSNSKPKKYFNIFASHPTLDTKDRTKSIVTKLLNKQPLNLYEKTINLINQTNVN